MAYQIDNFRGQFLTTVEDGTLNNATDLKLVGKNYAGYGEVQNENFIALLENFASSQAPGKPIQGQLWFDATSGAEKLKFYDGTAWRTAGGAEVGPQPGPTGLVPGDFWWDTTNEQLYAKGAGGFVLVGPQSTGAGNVTQMRSLTLNDNASPSVAHSVIAATINNAVVYIISNDTFTIAQSDAIAGFDTVRQGLTLVNTQNAAGGKTTSSFRFHGTATNAESLNGVPASEYVTSSGSLNFTQEVGFDDPGLVVGDDSDFKITVDGNTATIAQSVGDSILFKVNNGGSLTNSLIVKALSIEPGTPTTTLGTSSNRWDIMYANTFNGNATSSTGLKLSGTVYYPTSVSTASTLAMRDANSDIFARKFQGVATSAQYADLAEVYSTDKEYPTGTVMAVGGEAETRAAKVSDHAIGVISAEPAYLMNSTAEGQAIALKGRVPVRVTGPVSKGMAVYAWQDGVASTIASTGLVGIALESSTDVSEKLIECVLKV
jgi:hypothetical protein